MTFKEMTIYQIYPRSFYDSNGDGIGDLAGITAKLDYLKELGVDMVWITPFFASPQRDNGYDVANYYEIDPVFGTMADFDSMMQRGKELGISFMLDMVLNHSSTEHAWFQAALAGDEDKQACYFFKAGSTLPTNWQSKFGGSAWSYVEALDKHYLHLFDRTQADFNWQNPAVRSEMANIVNFWLDKGVMGLRFDVINLISKGSFADDHQGDGRKFYTDGPHVHAYLKELNKHSFGKNKAVVTVGEMSSTTLEACVGYSNPKEQELNMVFNFHHLKVDYENGNKWTLMPYDFILLKKILFSWQLGMQEADGWQALFWSNHDQPRVVSRFGSAVAKYHAISAKMLANAMYLMRGTPYIYQGEEIGLVNAHFQSIDQYRDVESLNYYQILAKQGKSKEEILAILGAKSRDHGRTPMPWSAHQPSAGFTAGTPWLELIEQYAEINVEQNLADKNSIFYHYKQMIALRKGSKAISGGMIIAHLLEDEQLFVYERVHANERYLIVANFYQDEAVIDLSKCVGAVSKEAKILLNNYADAPLYSGDYLKLRGYESMVFNLSF